LHKAHYQRARNRQPALGLLHQRSASTALQPLLILLARHPSKELARWVWTVEALPEGLGTDALFLWASAEAVNNRAKESAINNCFIGTSCAQCLPTRAPPDGTLHVGRRQSQKQRSADHVGWLPVSGVELTRALTLLPP
jgi:hypothetical protein